jgi:hypothetical protein
LQRKFLASGQAIASGEGLTETVGEGKGVIGKIVRGRCDKLGATAATRRPTAATRRPTAATRRPTAATRRPTAAAATATTSTASNITPATNQGQLQHQ